MAGRDCTCTAREARIGSGGQGGGRDEVRAGPRGGSHGGGGGCSSLGKATRGWWLPWGQEGSEEAAASWEESHWR